MYVVQVKSCPQDYRAWQQTMYAIFGQKWSKLHHGPLWSFVSSSACDDTSHSKILEVQLCACIMWIRVNIHLDLPWEWTGS